MYELEDVPLMIEDVETGLAWITKFKRKGKSLSSEFFSADTDVRVISSWVKDLMIETCGRVYSRASHHRPG